MNTHDYNVRVTGNADSVTNICCSVFNWFKYYTFWKGMFLATAIKLKVYGCKYILGVQHDFYTHM